MTKKNSSDIIDIKAVLNEYLSKWYLFVISVIVCLGLAFVYSKIKRPIYAVRANVLIAQEDSSPISSLGSLGSLLGAKGQVDDEIFVISSHSLYRDVAHDLGTNTGYRVRDGFMRNHQAFPDFPIEVVLPEQFSDTLSVPLFMKLKVSDKGVASGKLRLRRHTIAEFENGSLPLVFDTPYGSFTIKKTEYFPEGEAVTEMIYLTSYDLAAELLGEQITSDIASKRSNVISLGIDTENPDYGMAVLNEIIKKYNERGINEKNFQGEQTARFLDERLDLLNRDLNSVEMTLEQYKQQKGIIDIEAEAKYQTTKRGRLDETLLPLETQAEILKLTRDFLSDPANNYQLIPAAIDNEKLQPIIDSYNELVLNRMDLIESSNPNNQAVARVSAKIDAMRANILVSVKKSLESVDVKIRDIKNEQAQVAGRLGDVPTQEREYIDMKRQQEVKQQLYMYLLQRREETAMLLSNSVPKGQVVDEAFTMTKPLGMTRKMLFLLAFIIGLCLTPAYLFLRKILRNKFDSRQEVEKITDAPILGEMCVDRTGNALVVDAQSTTSTAELFRLLRSNLLFILNGTHDKVVMITSTSSGEGKSFISVNMAASLSLLHKRVLLIGMDIRNPQLAKYLGINPRYGLTQYLSSDDISLDQVITPISSTPGLDVIVAGPIPPNPSELLASNRVDEMIAQLRESYDYILLDTAPVGMVSDTFALDRISDATIYVCRANYTSLNDIRFIEEVYSDKRLKKLSVVINGTTSKKNYTYGYGKKNTVS